MSRGRLSPLAHPLTPCTCDPACRSGKSAACASDTMSATVAGLWAIQTSVLGRLGPGEGTRTEGDMSADALEGAGVSGRGTRPARG